MRLPIPQARDLAIRAVEMTRADQVEAIVIGTDSALTRFAGNRIHQNVTEEDAQVSIRAVVGKRVGVSSTNRLDDKALSACAGAALASAEHAPEDPEFPGLPAPEPVEIPDRFTAATEALDAEERGRTAGAIIDQSQVRELTSAGKVAVSDSVVAIANSLGVDVAMASSLVRATVLSMCPSGGSGWASYTGASADGLAATTLGTEAATLAERSSEPGALSPGEYTVVLAPEAVADLLGMLAYTGFSAKAVKEGSSFMTGRFGEKIFAESVTITDDATSPEAIGLTFDFEGMPKRRTPLIDAGVVAGPVTDSYWAARTGRANTGHALPAPNTYGPMPLDMEMAPGDASIDDMLAAVTRGVYVTRFHYVNVEDPVKAVLTGMTRDGTFLIEGGCLTRPLKNLRFTQSAVEALAHVTAIGTIRERVGEMMGSSLVPALTIERFSITGQTG